MAPSLVVPSERTPSGDLPLSTIDHLLPFIDPMLHVYGHGEQEPVKAIREALAKTLVPYYPVAGRLARVDGKLHVACSGEGVVLVQASADFSLEDVGYLESEPLMVPTEQLLPNYPPGTEKNDLPLAMQVTQFKCGGFSLGIVFHHAVFDGIGIGQFLIALSELCRGGLVQPTIKPVWRREAIPNWQKFTAGFLQKIAQLVKLDFELHYINVSLDCINQAKEEFFTETNRSCSTFEVVTAMVWQSRTRTMDLQLHAEVELGIIANTRHLYLRDLKPDEGYYGNCTHTCMLKAPSAQIANASLVEIVKLIKEGKASLETQAVNFFNGEPFMSNMDHTHLRSVDWRRLGFYETDYGYGKPTNVIPLHPIRSSFGYMMLLNSLAPKNGVRVRLNCVLKEHLNAFEEEMKKYMHV